MIGGDMCHSHRTHSESPSTRRRAAEEAGPHREFVHDAMKLGGAVVICITIWALTGAGMFWPAWVIVIGGMKLGVQAREVFGGSPGDPDDDVEDQPVAQPEPVDTWA